MKSNTISGFFQFVLGFFLGIVILSGSAVGVAYYLFTKMTIVPEKPIFPEEKTRSISAQTIPIQTKAKPIATQVAFASEGYRARVTWPQGLVLRAGPTTQSARLGGIAYNSLIVVLKEDVSVGWQKIREVQTGREGWIKSGNIEKIQP